jgi:acyl-CoA hydrolase
MKIAENFIVSLYLSNVLCIKISTPQNISTSCFILIHAYSWKMAVYEMTKPLTYLMKLVNLDTTW